jgi:hypothetical protein
MPVRGSGEMPLQLGVQDLKPGRLHAFERPAGLMVC